jgi:tripartite-type tricarboxylate transporter receptor subunit TctC
MVQLIAPRTMFAAVLCLSAAMSGQASAADAAGTYPNRPVRFILPNASGSSADILSRIITKALGDELGQQVIVDSRPGAGGLLGVELIAKATPDGYTIGRGNSPGLAIAPHMYKKLPYDPFRDLMPVALTDKGQSLLCVHPSVPATTVKELIALLKAKPEQYGMASPGVGSAGHLSGALFASMAGIKVLHVPYKSAGHSVMAVVMGESHWTFTPMGATLPHLASGRLRALAVSDIKRSPRLPDIPTASEAGVRGYQATTWGGLVVPRGTPAAIVAKLNAAVVKTLGTPDMQQSVANNGSEAAPSTPEEFARFIREEYDRIGKVVRSAKLTAD